MITYFTYLTYFTYPTYFTSPPKKKKLKRKIC
mgnify:FL=1